MSLTQPDIDKAKLFYLEHLDHVSQLMHDSKEETCYPPTDTYDVIRPEVWKPAHWRWFWMNYIDNSV